MAQGKFGERIIKLRCVTCKEINYYTRKNKKLVERKIELKKFCNRCRKHQVHKEIKK
ncbi:MAG: 50S ribosomal protein L33 [Patescibacteria group bacterium]